MTEEERAREFVRTYEGCVPRGITTIVANCSGVAMMITFHDDRENYSWCTFDMHKPWHVVL